MSQENKHYYSKASNSFYADILKERYEASGSWPSDALEVSDEDYQKFTGVPEDGFVRGFKRGKLTWVKISSAESSQRVEAHARFWRDEQLHAADIKVNKLEDAGEDAKLWRAYRVELRNWPATKDFPETKPVVPSI